MSGTNAPRFVLWRSNDGTLGSWRLDPRPMGGGAEWLPDDLRIEWNTGDVVLY